MNIVMGFANYASDTRSIPLGRSSVGVKQW
jgi:hypothetical protein